MPRIENHMDLAAPIETVWAFHAEVANLIRVVPRNTRPHLLKLHERFEPGAEFILRLGLGYWWIHWHARITEVDPPRRFVDEQVSGPFLAWRHEHRFESLEDGKTRIVDTVTYDMPWGMLGSMVDTLIVRRQIRSLLCFRERALRRLLQD
jgi:ligand-binding SRPBCC domain-containing protein